MEYLSNFQRCTKVLENHYLCKAAEQPTLMQPCNYDYECSGDQRCIRISSNDAVTFHQVIFHVEMWNSRKFMLISCFYYLFCEKKNCIYYRIFSIAFCSIENQTGTTTWIARMLTFARLLESLGNVCEPFFSSLQYRHYRWMKWSVKLYVETFKKIISKKKKNPMESSLLHSLSDLSIFLYISIVTLCMIDFLCFWGNKLSS